MVNDKKKNPTTIDQLYMIFYIPNRSVVDIITTITDKKTQKPMASLKYYKITLKRYVHTVTWCNLSRYYITLLYIIVCGSITRIMLLHNITDDRVADPQLKLFRSEISKEKVGNIEKYVFISTFSSCYIVKRAKGGGFNTHRRQLYACAAGSDIDQFRGGKKLK